MGLFNIFSTKTEERMHQQLAEILAEYHKLKSLVERQKVPVEHVISVHKRIDAINSSIRSINSMPAGVAKVHYLQQLLHSEKALLEMQKKMAHDLERLAAEAIRSERKTERSAKELKAA